MKGSLLWTSHLSPCLRGGGGGGFGCVTILPNLPDLPINLCNIRVTATTPALPPPLHWQ